MATAGGIAGDWVHAHEQDHDGLKVFVPADTPLPPSRGRRRLSLRADGSFHESMAGADDKRTASSGRYEFKDGRLELSYAQAGKTAVMEVALSANGRRLETKRV